MKIVSAPSCEVAVIIPIPAVHFSKLLIPFVGPRNNIESLHRLAVVESRELGLVAHFVEDLNFCNCVRRQVSQRQRRIAAEEGFSVDKDLLDRFPLSRHGPIRHNNSRQFADKVFRKRVWIRLEGSCVELGGVCPLHSRGRRSLDIHFTQLNRHLHHHQIRQIHCLVVDVDSPCKQRASYI